MCLQKNHILTLLGWVLTPLLLCSLFAIMIIGFTTAGNLQMVHHEKGAMFLYGLKEGYNTMDLLAAFFFSSTILRILQKTYKDSSSSSSGYINIALYASVIAGFFLR